MAWCRRQISQLVELNMIVQIRKDRGFDYEIYDYIPEIESKNPTGQKCPLTLDKNVHSPLDKNVHLEIRDKKQDIRLSLSEEKNKTEIQKNQVDQELDNFKEEIKNNPLYPRAIDSIKTRLNIPDIPNIDEMALEEMAITMISQNVISSKYQNYLEVAYSKSLQGYQANLKTQNIQKQLDITTKKEAYYDAKKTDLKSNKTSEASKRYGKPPHTLDATNFKTKQIFELKKRDCELDYDVKVINFQQAKELWKETDKSETDKSEFEFNKNLTNLIDPKKVAKINVDMTDEEKETKRQVIAADLLQKRKEMIAKRNKI